LTPVAGGDRFRPGQFWRDRAGDDDRGQRANVGDIGDAHFTIESRVLENLRDNLL
jgi:hypothetical protein